MAMKPECVSCGKTITWQFYLCNTCEKEYGKRKDDWPEWLGYLVNEEAKQRMRYRDGYWARRQAKPSSDHNIVYIMYWDDDRFP